MSGERAMREGERQRIGVVVVRVVRLHLSRVMACIYEVTLASRFVCIF